MYILYYIKASKKLQFIEESSSTLIVPTSLDCSFIAIGLGEVMSSVSIASLRLPPSVSDTHCTWMSKKVSSHLSYPPTHSTKRSGEPFSLLATLILLTYCIIRTAISSLPKLTQTAPSLCRLKSSTTHSLPPSSQAANLAAKQKTSPI